MKDIACSRTNILLTCRIFIGLQFRLYFRTGLKFQLYSVVIVVLCVNANDRASGEAHMVIFFTQSMIRLLEYRMFRIQW